jgi:hypothetical protein
VLGGAFLNLELVSESGMFQPADCLMKPLPLVMSSNTEAMMTTEAPNRAYGVVLSARDCEATVLGASIVTEAVVVLADESPLQ